MAISEEQSERLTLLFQGLEPELKNLNERSRSFVEDQMKRHEQYGSSMFLSPKQSRWLEDLYAEHCGEAEATGGGERDDRDPRSNEDMDDEIPF